MRLIIKDVHVMFRAIESMRVVNKEAPRPELVVRTVSGVEHRIEFDTAEAAKERLEAIMYSIAECA